jgi:hypothetical protein
MRLPSVAVTISLLEFAEEAQHAERSLRRRLGSPAPQLTDSSLLKLISPSEPQWDLFGKQDLVLVLRTLDPPHLADVATVGATFDRILRLAFGATGALLLRDVP